MRTWVIFGGARVTSGLQEKFGAHRVFDSPLAEGGIAAIAMGMGLNGLRPVAEMQFADYIFPAYDQIVNEIAKLRHRSGGEYSNSFNDSNTCWRRYQRRPPSQPSIQKHSSRTPWTPRWCIAQTHNAKGLLTSAIECNDPVISLNKTTLSRPILWRPTQSSNLE